MHASLGPLAEQFALQTDLLANALEGIGDEEANRRPEGGTNSIAFLAGHLADARFFLAGQLGSTLKSPLVALAGVNDIDALQGDLPPLAEVLQHWRAGGAELSERFSSLEEEALAAESPARFPVRDGSLLGMVAFLAHHEAYHLGQIALLRRQLGHAAMSYARPEA